MKGIELPINILVIVAVAIIVLLGVIALFYSSWFSSTGPVTSQAALTSACNQASRQTCAVAIPADITVSSYKNYASLQEFCEEEYTSTDWTGANWGANGAESRLCLTLACGMGCS